MSWQSRKTQTNRQSTKPFSFYTTNTLAPSLTEHNPWTEEHLKQLIKEHTEKGEIDCGVISVNNPLGGKNLVFTNHSPHTHIKISSEQAHIKAQNIFPVEGKGSIQIADNKGNTTYIDPKVYPFQIVTAMSHSCSMLENFASTSAARQHAYHLGKLASQRLLFLKENPPVSPGHEGAEVSVLHLLSDFACGLACIYKNQEDMDRVWTKISYHNQLAAFDSIYNEIENLLPGSVPNSSKLTKSTKSIVTSMANIKSDMLIDYTMVDSMPGESDVVRNMFSQRKPYKLYDPSKDRSQIKRVTKSINDKLRLPFPNSLVSGLTELTSAWRALAEIDQNFVLFYAKDEYLLGPTRDFDKDDPIAQCLLVVLDMIYARSDMHLILHILKPISAMSNQSDYRAFLLFILTMIRQMPYVEALKIGAEPTGQLEERVSKETGVVIAGHPFASIYSLLNLAATKSAKDPPQYILTKLPKKFMSRAPSWSKIPTTDISVCPSVSSSIVLLGATGSVHMVERSEREILREKTMKSSTSSEVGVRQRKQLSSIDSDEIWFEYSALAFNRHEPIAKIYRNPLQFIVVRVLFLAGVTHEPPYDLAEAASAIYLIRNKVRGVFLQSTNRLKRDETSSIRTAKQQLTYYKMLSNNHSLYPEEQNIPRAFNHDRLWRTTLFSEESYRDLQDMMKFIVDRLQTDGQLLCYKEVIQMLMEKRKREYQTMPKGLDTPLAQP